MKRPFLYFLIGITFFLFSCSFNTPSIIFPKKERIYYYDKQNTIVERLSIFVLLEDTDGRNDYKELTLREDATGLEWSLHRENTVFLQEPGQNKNMQWAGSNKFVYPRRFFPAGSYTVTVSDLAGNKTKTALSLSESKPITTAPFHFTYKDNQWELTTLDSTVCTVFSLIMLTADMQPLSIQRITAKKGSLQELQQQAPDARYIQCFGENTDQSIAFLTTPLMLP